MWAQAFVSARSDRPLRANAGDDRPEDAQIKSRCCGTCPRHLRRCAAWNPPHQCPARPTTNPHDCTVQSRRGDVPDVAAGAVRLERHCQVRGGHPHSQNLDEMRLIGATTDGNTRTPRRLYHGISRLLGDKKQSLDKATTAHLMRLQLCVHYIPPSPRASIPPPGSFTARANAINDGGCRTLRR